MAIRSVACRDHGKEENFEEKRANANGFVAITSWEELRCSFHTTSSSSVGIDDGSELLGLLRSLVLLGLLVLLADFLEWHFCRRDHRLACGFCRALCL